MQSLSIISTHLSLTYFQTCHCQAATLLVCYDCPSNLVLLLNTQQSLLWYLDFVHQSAFTPTNSTGNSTYAGATAAIIANFVLIGYVIVAMREDAGERAEAEEKDKKSR
jgi:hypothetical protein